MAKKASKNKRRACSRREGVVGEEGGLTIREVLGGT